MFNSLNTISDAQTLYRQIDNDAQLRAEAARLFEQHIGKGSGLIQRVLRRGKKCALRSLADLQLHITGQHSIGLQTVIVDKIVGSENRTTEFDGSFTPQADHLESRWVNVAVAYFKGISLPPIELFQVGDEYYVRDGHHRVSVARALDQAMIHATVTVLK